MRSTRSLRNALAHYGMARLTRTSDPRAPSSTLMRPSNLTRTWSMPSSFVLWCGPGWVIVRCSTTSISWSRRQTARARCATPPAHWPSTPKPSATGPRWSGRFSFSSLRSRQAFPPGSPWQTPI